MKTTIPKSTQRKEEGDTRQKKNKTSALTMVDNRPEAAAQAKFISMIQGTAQREEIDDKEELAQTKAVAQRVEEDELKPEAAQLKENKTGMPDNLKNGLENLSGMSMDHVNAHYNSPEPAQLNAHAFTQGSDIHVASGQEKHLAHEGWHVVQQAQGRVQPTVQMAGTQINDDAGLETEADVMGAKALQMHQSTKSECEFPIHPVSQALGGGIGKQPVQRIVYYSKSDEYKTDGGSEIKMENKGQKANCHGYTYGTWADDREGLNPFQGDPKGVALIVEKETGGERDCVTELDKNQTFNKQPAVGNLIAIFLNGLKAFIHSARVASATGKKFSEVEVENVQGYGGAAENKKFSEVPQSVNKNNEVHLLAKTPTTRKE